MTSHILNMVKLSQETGSPRQGKASRLRGRYDDSLTLAAIPSLKLASVGMGWARARPIVFRPCSFPSSIPHPSSGNQAINQARAPHTVLVLTVL